MLPWLLGSAAVMAAVLSAHAQFVRAAAPWRRSLQAAAKQSGVSASLIAAIAWKETNFDPSKVGSAGERGMTQFLPAAASDVGIDYNQLIGDPDLQLLAAGRYLAQQLKRFDGDLLTAVRAYNAGPGHAHSEPKAGLSYAIEVCTNAAIDRLYTSIVNDTGEYV